jgi:hypothetical protein
MVCSTARPAPEFIGVSDRLPPLLGIGICTSQASRRVYPGGGGCKRLLALNASRVLTAKWLIRERIVVNVLPRG